jgi:hypothetical protein
VNKEESLTMDRLQPFLGYVIGASPELAVGLEAWVTQLKTRRTWFLKRPPSFVNEVSDPGDPARGDAPIMTLGFAMDVLSPDRKTADGELERRTYEDVKFLVEEAVLFSRRAACTFEFELDGVYVGAIVNGEPNRSLAEGLLGEWARNLPVTKPPS